MDSIDDMLRQERCWVELGVVLAPPVPSTIPGGALAARMVLVALVPSGGVVHARVANLGQGLAKGVFPPLAPKDEVLVFFPGGDPNRAVVFGGLGNGVSANPIANLGLQLLLMHPAGVELRSADGLPAHGLVHGQLLAGLAPYLTALETFMFACSTATLAPQIATAAVAFMAAVQQVGAAPSPFATQLTASASSGTAPGVGGPPFATSLHKATP